MGALIAMGSVVCLVIALLLQATNSGHNPLAWFIAGMLLYVISMLVSSWESMRPRVPRA